MARYRVEISATAERQIRKLPRADQIRVIRVIQTLCRWTTGRVPAIDVQPALECSRHARPRTNIAKARSAAGIEGKAWSCGEFLSRRERRRPHRTPQEGAGGRYEIAARLPATARRTGWVAAVFAR